MRAPFPRFLGACLAPLPAVCLLALLWFPAFAAAEEHAPLKVGLEDYYPPFALTDETGRHSGFDHEIGEALCNAFPNLSRLWWTNWPACPAWASFG